MTAEWALYNQNFGCTVIHNVISIHVLASVFAVESFSPRISDAEMEPFSKTPKGSLSNDENLGWLGLYRGLYYPFI